MRPSFRPSGQGPMAAKVPEMGSVHTAIADLRGKFERLELHAARSGREVMDALAQVNEDSTAVDARELGAEIESAIDALLLVLPAYAPPLNVMHRVMYRVEEALRSRSTVAELKAWLAAEASGYRQWSSDARARLASLAASLICSGSTIYTFTLSETTLRALQEARKQGKVFRVLVTESRPNRDGLVTTRELAELGVDVEVTIDAAMGELVRRADLMLLGAEAIMADGSAVCKVGTYPSALLARAFRVPVFVLVDTGKLNVTSLLGLPLPLTPLGPNAVSDVPPGTPVLGRLFDQTPGEMIRGIVTERGLISPAAASAIIQQMPISTRLSQKLEAWAYRE